MESLWKVIAAASFVPPCYCFTTGPPCFYKKKIKKREREKKKEESHRQWVLGNRYHRGATALNFGHRNKMLSDPWKNAVRISPWNLSARTDKVKSVCGRITAGFLMDKIRVCLNIYPAAARQPGAATGKPYLLSQQKLNGRGPHLSDSSVFSVCEAGHSTLHTFSPVLFHAKTGDLYSCIYFWNPVHVSFSELLTSLLYFKSTFTLSLVLSCVDVFVENSCVLSKCSVAPAHCLNSSCTCIGPSH